MSNYLGVCYAKHDKTVPSILKLINSPICTYFSVSRPLFKLILFLFYLPIFLHPSIMLAVILKISCHTLNINLYNVILVDLHWTLTCQITWMYAMLNMEVGSASKNGWLLAPNNHPLLDDLTDRIKTIQKWMFFDRFLYRGTEWQNKHPKLDEIDYPILDGRHFTSKIGWHWSPRFGWK